MNLLYFLLIGSLLSFALNSPILGLTVAVAGFCWLAVLAWQNRHVPHDPRDY
jgi:hypothetical protein